MNAQLHDFPTHVEQSEAIRRRRAEVLAIDHDRLNDDLRVRLDILIGDLIEIQKTIRAHDYEDNLEAIQDAIAGVMDRI